MMVVCFLKGKQTGTTEKKISLLLPVGDGHACPFCHEKGMRGEETEVWGENPGYAEEEQYSTSYSLSTSRTGPF